MPIYGSGYDSLEDGGAVIILGFYLPILDKYIANLGVGTFDKLSIHLELGDIFVGKCDGNGYAIRFCAYISNTLKGSGNHHIFQSTGIWITLPSSIHQIQSDGGESVFFPKI